MSLFSELKRRNVFRVAVAYAVVAWFLVQAADIMLENFGAPGWVFKTVTGLLALGFPLALFLSWAYELTPEGVKKTEDVDAAESVTPQTARRIDRLIVAALLGVIAILVVDRVWFVPSSGPPPAEASIASAEPATSVHSIAVLPFVNMSRDADNAYFADGISEEILNLLAGVRDLSVASRTSAFAFKGKDTPIPAIAESLGVRYVLEGSVRKAADRVRVTAQLIDAERDRHLWSETYDRTLEDIFAIQDEIAGAIGNALQVELLGASGQSVKAETVDPEIYAKFLEARHNLRLRRTEPLRDANLALIEVVEAAPDFARAHVLLGEAYLLNATLGHADPIVPDSVALSQARLHAETARELNPDLSGIDLILGSLAESGGEQVTALDHYSRAIELEPREPRPHHWRGMQFCDAGFLDRGLADLATARRLDPENPNVHYALADCLLSANLPDLARTMAHRGLELGQRAGMELVAITELEAGDREAFAGLMERTIEEGFRPESFREALDRMLATSTTGGLDGEAGDELEGESVGNLLLALDRYEAALDALEISLDTMEIGLAGMWSNDHRAFRANPRFVTIMDGFGFVEFWRELGAPPDCRAADDWFTCGHGHEPIEFGP